MPYICIQVKSGRDNDRLRSGEHLAHQLRALKLAPAQAFVPQRPPGTPRPGGARDYLAASAACAGLGGSVDPEPALLRADELVLIGLHPPHDIDPIPKGLLGLFGQPPEVYIRTRILLVL